MITEEEKAWVLIDEPDDEIIVGNNAGLLKLREAIDKALDTKEVDIADFVEDTNIFKIVLEDKAVYLKNYSEYKETIWQKTMGVFLAIWFIVLPFVAIGLIIYFFYSSNLETEDCGIRPLQNAIPANCNNKL